MSISKNTTIQEPKICFAIMPISDVSTHPTGHFSHVYNNIIKPACEKAGYTASRADEVKAANLIQLDILRKLIDAPVAICDLSTRNPNVLFELGIRQAFDKPVVLIQEEGTQPIFDISGLRYLSYSKDMKYHEVLKIQEELSNAILETLKEHKLKNNVNSIVNLLALKSPAKLPELKENKESLAIEALLSEIRNLRTEVQSIKNNKKPQNIFTNSIPPIQPLDEFDIQNKLFALKTEYEILPSEAKELQKSYFLSKLNKLRREYLNLPIKSLDLRFDIEEFEKKLS